jgi:hypothetical protein
MLGGWFSSFKKSDAGFQIRHKTQAETLDAVLNSAIWARGLNDKHCFQHRR